MAMWVGNPETASDPTGQRIVDSGGGGVPAFELPAVTFTPPSGDITGAGVARSEAQASSNGGGCAFNPYGEAADCFSPQANTQHSVV